MTVDKSVLGDVVQRIRSGPEKRLTSPDIYLSRCQVTAVTLGFPTTATILWKGTSITGVRVVGNVRANITGSSYPLLVNGSDYFVIGLEGAPATGNSTTGGRPSTSGMSVGTPWWDTTLGKPIWWNGANWKDATGATV